MPDFYSFPVSVWTVQFFPPCSIANKLQRACFPNIPRKPSGEWNTVTQTSFSPIFWRGWNGWTLATVSWTTRIFSVDGRPNPKNKAKFSNFKHSL